MFAGRLKKFRKLLKENLLDGYITQEPKNIYYLTGFTGDFGILLITLDRAILYTTEMFKIEAENVFKGIEIKLFKTGRTSEINTTLKEDTKHLKSIGLEVENLHVPRYRGYVFALSNKVKDVEDLVKILRKRKDKKEIAFIRKAQEITDRIFSWVLENLEPGKLTELDLAAEMEYLMKKFGASGPSFPTIVASGENSALPHAKPGRRKIDKGVLLLDFGVFYKGYASDMTRTIHIGKVEDEEFIKVYNIVLKAQELAESLVKADLKGAEVDKVAREYITQQGYGEFFTHGLGHGVGLDIHEAPYIAPFYDKKLEASNIITIEPGIYLKGKFGVRIEDMVLVKEDGAEVLPKSRKDLVIL